MLIKNQMTEVKWNSKTKKYYVNRGYTFTKMGDSFFVKVEDLTRASKSLVRINCDYCHKEYTSTYNNYVVCKEKNKIQKDSCKKCTGLKLIESNQLIYGVNSTSQIKEVKDQQIATNLLKYGYTNPAKNKKVKEKTIQTNLSRYGTMYTIQNEEIRASIKAKNNKNYGVDFPFQSKEIVSKVQKTHLQKYGSINPLHNKIVKQKALNTNMKKYGVKNVFELNAFQIKAKESLFKNKKGVCSKQQKHICELLNGTLNYPLNRYLLDIAFPDEKVYIEYDGGGHDLTVKLGNMTNEEFKQKEIIRNNIIKREGWSKITIISRKDMLPLDEIIRKIYMESLQIFQDGRSWVIYDVDNQIMRYYKNSKHYDFGELRMIRN